MHVTGRMEDRIEPGAVSPGAERVPGTATTVLQGTTKQEPTVPAIPISDSASDGILFIRKGKAYHPQQQLKLRNNLLLAVGFLELANAGDFAANVWNDIPVPIYAAVLMGIGGTLALLIASFSIKDARLSWHNFKGLRAERQLLNAQLARCDTASDDKVTTRTIHAALDMNFREMGTEIVDRVGMDATMGFGALLVGVGTLMAIAGADPVIFQTSNLLSGYIGNAPCALYGLVNLAWSAYVWIRARRLRQAGSRSGLPSGPVQSLLKMRTFTFQIHSALNGTTGVVAGAASLVTATMWWGYVVLAPCIIMSVVTNVLWRRRVGYNRPFFHQPAPPLDEGDLTTELHHMQALQLRVRADVSDPLRQLVSDPQSSACVVEFISRNQLFEDFCVHVLADAEFTARIFDTDQSAFTVKPADFVFPPEEALNDAVVQAAQQWFATSGRKCFNDRENYLVEFFGCLVRHAET